MIDSLKSIFRRLIAEQQVDTFRYLSAQFTLDSRLIGLIGARGVGKTTLLLQTIKQQFPSLENVFYFSADHIYFNTNSLYKFVEHLNEYEGINIFFIDEIHKYPNWDQEIKNIYDSFPAIKIIFSGSSSLNLVKGSYDLSRRAQLYRLQGLSFREYLYFKLGNNLNTINFANLLIDPLSYNNLLSNIPMVKAHFNDYLHFGYYPFFMESNREIYYEKILRVVEKTIYEDIASFYKLKTQNLPLFKKILNYLSTIEPGLYNHHNLAKNLAIDDKTVVNYISILEATGLIRSVYPYATGNRLLNKPEKIFINNTTLGSAINSALGEDIPVGYLRELFFLQSLGNVGQQIFYSNIGDYQTKDCIFEIGGKNKTNKQVKHSNKKAYLVKDHILFATRTEIPLYLFGFLY